MTTRLLAPHEWPAKLLGTELEGALPFLVPGDTRILVAEDASGRVVGCWAAIRYWHVEGGWIHPLHRRKGSVMRKGLQAMASFLKAINVRVVWTAATTEEVRGLVIRMGGAQIPGDHFAVRIGGA